MGQHRWCSARALLRLLSSLVCRQAGGRELARFQHTEGRWGNHTHPFSPKRTDWLTPTSTTVPLSASAFTSSGRSAAARQWLILAGAEVRARPTEAGSPIGTLPARTTRGTPEEETLWRTCVHAVQKTAQAVGERSGGRTVEAVGMGLGGGMCGGSGKGCCARRLEARGDDPVGGVHGDADDAALLELRSKQDLGRREGVGSTQVTDRDEGG